MSVGGVLRDWRTAGAAYVVIRIAGVVGTSPVRFGDSAGYTRVSLLHPGMRTWPVPLLYSVLRDDTNRVVAQAVVGCAVWVLFARLATRRSRFPATTGAAILAVGLAPQVTRFDTAILSESFAISAAVLLMATLVGTVHSRNWRVPALCAWVVFVMIRPENLVVGVAAGVAAVLAILLRRHVPSLAVLVVLVTGVAAAQQLGSITTVRDLNMYTVLATRVMNDSARYAWFVDHGMPNIPGIRLVDGYDYSFRVPDDLRSYLGIPDEQDVPAIVIAGGMDLARWVHTDSWPTYARRVVTHPRETWDLVSSYAGPSLNARSHTFLPTTNRRIVPDWVFGRWQWWMLASVTGLLSLVVLSRTRELLAVSVVTLSTVIIFPLVTVASGIEQQRHAAVVAVMVRLAALAALALGTTAAPVPAPEGGVR